MTEPTDARPSEPVPGPCIFDGCVSRHRHWHGGFPGGYDNPDDPDGPPIDFTSEPEPGVRDYNGALLQPAQPATDDSLEAVLAAAIHETSSGCIHWTSVTWGEIVPCVQRASAILATPSGSRLRSAGEDGKADEAYERASLHETLLYYGVACAHRDMVIRGLIEAAGGRVVVTRDMFVSALRSELQEVEVPDGTEFTLRARS